MLRSGRAAGACSIAGSRRVIAGRCEIRIDALRRKKRRRHIQCWCGPHGIVWRAGKCIGLSQGFP